MSRRELMPETMRYFKDLDHYDLLSQDAVLELIKKAQGGCIKSRNRVIEGNVRLVISIVKRMGCFKSSNVMDLISEGNLGLFTAIEKFDVKRGNTFSTYATHWIRQKIGRYIGNQNLVVRIPVYVHERISKIRKKESMGKKLTEQETTYLEKNCIKYVLLDKPLEGGNLHQEINAHDIISDESIDVHEKLCKKECSMEYLDALDKMEPRDRFIIIGRDAGRILQEVGTDLGISRERVRQLEKIARAELKRRLQRRYNVFSR